MSYCSPSDFSTLPVQPVSTARASHASLPARLPAQMASDGEGRAGGPAPAKQQHTVEYCSSDTPAKCKRCKQLIARGHLTYGCQEEGQGGRADLYHWRVLGRAARGGQAASSGGGCIG